MRTHQFGIPALMALRTACAITAVAVTIETAAPTTVALAAQRPTGELAVAAMARQPTRTDPRSSSTQWMPDVAARLAVLDSHALTANTRRRQTPLPGAGYRAIIPPAPQGAQR